MNVTFLVNKVQSRLKREYFHLPIVSDLARRSYKEKVSKYKSHLPTLNNQNREIVDAIQRDGICVTTADSLSNPRTIEAFKAAKNLLLSSSLDSSILPHEISCKGNYGVPGKILQNYPEIILWGLDEQLLDLAENYIGLPIFCLGAEVKRCLPMGGSTGVRKWHKDTEDYRMVKIIIYLNDVDEEGGPFQYISGNKSDIADKKLGYKFGLISDKSMQKYVPYQDWISCLGEQNTVIVTDTAKVFHRAKPPIDKERLSITFHYISQNAMHLRNKDLSISTGVKHMCKDLSKRQLNCLVSF